MTAVVVENRTLGLDTKLSVRPAFDSVLGRLFGLSGVNDLAAKIRAIFKQPGIEPHLYTFGPGVPILGPELVVNGDGSSLGGWTVAQDVGSATVVDGAFSLTKTSTGNNTSISQALATTVGKAYRLKYETKSSTGVYNVTCQSSVGYSSAVGALGFDFSATSSSTTLKIEQGTIGPATSVFDNISVREILGYSNTYSGFVAGNYFDSAGTTHASVDGSVGLVLDAAGSVGAELLPSGTVGAAVGAPGSLPTGWQGGITTNGITRQVVNVGADFIDLRLTGTSTSTWADFLGVIGTTVPVTPGQTFRFALPTDTVVGGSMPAGGSVSYGAVFQFSGTFVSQVAMQNGVVTVPVGVNQLRLYNTIANYSSGAAVDVTIRVPASASCKQITGIHATQSTPGYKPTERNGIVNLLTWSNDLTNAVWGIKSAGGTATTNSVSFTTDPFGRVLHSYTHAAGAITVAASFSPSDAGKAVRLGVWDSVLDGLTTGGSSPLIIPTSGLVVFNITSSGGAGHVGVIGTGVAVTLSNPSVGLFAGTLTAAQILAAGGIPLTTTAPASSQAGVNYLEFDGVDDRLSSTGSFVVGSGATFVFAGMLPTLGSYRFLFGQGTNGCAIFIGPNGEVGLAQTGGSGVFSENGTIVAGQAFVLTLKLSVSGGVATGSIRKNGGGMASGSFSLNTGAFASGNFNLFADSGGSACFKGANYQSCIIASELSMQDITVIEKQAASLAGIQL